MASYEELYTLSLDASLVRRLTIAVAIAAEAIREEDPATANHDARVLWAKRALNNPDGMARQMLLVALAQNSAVPAATILAATDATLLSAVNAGVSLLM